MKIAGVVILYNYTIEVIENIKTYSSFCDKIYAIDNSDVEINVELKNRIIEIGNIDYISLGKNEGIAKALNIGISKADEEGMRWILIMDQDSRFENNLLDEYMKVIEKEEKVAVIVPNYKFDRKKLNIFYGYKEIDYEMQSANLVNIEIWKNLGKYKENFFIDVVDYEYCIRAKKMGYKIFQCGEAILEHQPAITKTKKVLNRSFKYGYCSPERIYYQARNLLWTANKYKYFKLYLILAMKWVKILLLFDRKKEFFNYFNRGIKDCKNNKFGICEKKEEK